MHDIYNQHQTPRFAFMNRVFARIGDLPIKNAFPPLLWKNFTKKIRKLNMKRENRKPLDLNFRKELLIKTKPEVENLSRFLNRDLVKLWGYG